MRTYSELLTLPSLEERFEYLRLNGQVSEFTFGSGRWANQQFYHSREWRQIRSFVMARDLGLELGLEDVPIRGSIYVHHMNPLTMDDLTEATENMLNPEFLISVSHRTHNAIHYGDEEQLPKTAFVERRPGDTKLW